MRRTALVTGAAHGLGALAARRLAAAAWDVVAVDVDEVGLAKTALRSPNMHVRACDVGDSGAVADLLAVTGPVHRVVHAAALSPAAPPLTQPLTEVEHVLRTDVLGAVHIARATLPGMLERGSGELVLCAPPPAAGATAAASGAVAAYTETLYHEYGGQGVVFRCVRLDGETAPRRVLDALDRSFARPPGDLHVRPGQGRAALLGRGRAARRPVRTRTPAPH
ncbi:SDR family NAD(P)-dependent oxidoreductase [Actinomadura sp. NAK00032]|uniref:SDR family NAD(P)-dependent oxidoreductase n=1 Tax=Actinomadura sp. NAK00032 TaxID=2742128 RepID=UPI0015921408|nr:SDR family NAD(P)-dependent oxidoreductase [Actinomadura sp. NAK00032]QKW39049.1 SDR family NAD(P)-dependent oxidoreductase [Actinomadura sp. NAK00032]